MGALISFSYGPITEAFTGRINAELTLRGYNSKKGSQVFYILSFLISEVSGS